eukprot:2219868-Pleurochrysis_carterae.AAC.1
MARRRALVVAVLPARARVFEVALHRQRPLEEADVPIESCHGRAGQRRVRVGLRARVAREQHRPSRFP